MACSVRVLSAVFFGFIVFPLSQSVQALSFGDIVKGKAAEAVGEAIGDKLKQADEVREPVEALSKEQDSAGEDQPAPSEPEASSPPPADRDAYASYNARPGIKGTASAASIAAAYSLELDAGRLLKPAAYRHRDNWGEFIALLGYQYMNLANQSDPDKVADQLRRFSSCFAANYFPVAEARQYFEEKSGSGYSSQQRAASKAGVLNLADDYAGGNEFEKRRTRASFEAAYSDFLQERSAELRAPMQFVMIDRVDVGEYDFDKQAFALKHNSESISTRTLGPFRCARGTNYAGLAPEYLPFKGTTDIKLRDLPIPIDQAEAFANELDQSERRVLYREIEFSLVPEGDSPACDFKNETHGWTSARDCNVSVVVDSVILYQDEARQSPVYEAPLDLFTKR